MRHGDKRVLADRREGKRRKDLDPKYTGLERRIIRDRRSGKYRRNPA